MKYIFSDDQPMFIKNAKQADPQAFGDALETITRKHGELKPKNVVEAARNKRHVLHKHFEWDDGLAAEKYRLDQARTIIRIVRVNDDETDDGTTRAFQSIHAGDGTSYKSIEDIRGSVTFQVALLKSARAELESFKRRYKNLKDVCDAVSKVQKLIDERAGVNG